MNTLEQALLSYPNPEDTNPAVRSGLVLVLAPHAARAQMLPLAARLALLGPLLVIDGGNRFNAYQVALHIRRQSATHFKEALERIRAARAFTPYQMLALLEATLPLVEAGPANPAPILALDLLDTFYDESLPQAERRRLLVMCLGHLRRLSAAAAVVVSVRPPRPPQGDPQGLVGLVQDAADQVFFFEEALTPGQALPARLF